MEAEVSERLITRELLLIWARKEARKVAAEPGHSSHWHEGANEMLQRLVNAVLDDEL